MHGKLRALLKTSPGRCHQLATVPKAGNGQGLWAQNTAVSCRKSPQRREKRQEFWETMCWKKSFMPGWELFTNLALNYLNLNRILLILIETWWLSREVRFRSFQRVCLLIFILGGWGREGGETCYLEGERAREEKRGRLNKKKNPALQNKTPEYLLVFPLSHDAGLFSENYINFSNLTSASVYLHFIPHILYLC